MLVLTIIGVAIIVAPGMLGATVARRSSPIEGVSLGFLFWLSFFGLCVVTASLALLGRGHQVFYQLAFFSTVAALVCGSLALGSSLLVDISRTNAVGKVAVFCVAAAPLAFIGAMLLFMFMWSFAETMP